MRRKLRLGCPWEDPRVGQGGRRPAGGLGEGGWIHRGSSDPACGRPLRARQSHYVGRTPAVLRVRAFPGGHLLAVSVGLNLGGLLAFGRACIVHFFISFFFTMVKV